MGGGVQGLLEGREASSDEPARSFWEIGRGYFSSVTAVPKEVPGRIQLKEQLELLGPSELRCGEKKPVLEKKRG